MSNPRQLRLAVASGPDAGAFLLMAPDREVVVGRSGEADLRLHDPALAARHFTAWMAAEPDAMDGLWIRALDGAPMHYREARVREAWVPTGAVLCLGATTVVVESDLPAAKTEADGLPPSPSHHFGRLTGQSVAMRRVFTLLERVAPSELPVLIVGETGTGKELCAEAIHAASPRAAAPLVVCDLSAIAPSLIESELFGHVRGAFTSAHRDHVGAFARASGGTLFLDEIGELDLQLQPRLLRALESQQVKPIGGCSFLSIDARIVAATSRDLAAEVRAGRFRADLLHRIAVVEVELPPLRARREDLTLLVEELVAEGPPLTTAAYAALLEHPWPGNVRELRNVLQRAQALAGPAEAITPPFLRIASSQRSTQVLPFVSSPEVALGAYQRAKEVFEGHYVAELVRRAGGNISRAAREGGLDRVHLHRLLKKHRPPPS